MKSESSHRTTSVRVLIVDDEATFRETLAKVLTRRTFAVELASNGQEAVACLSDDDFDVVVLDWKMPGLGGLETLQTLRKTRPDTRVVVLTGHASVGAGLEAMQARAADFLLKPVEIDHLVEVIRGAALSRASTSG